VVVAWIRWTRPATATVQADGSTSPSSQKNIDGSGEETKGAGEEEKDDRVKETAVGVGGCGAGDGGLGWETCIISWRLRRFAFSSSSLVVSMQHYFHWLQS
jgi:hypothetical protein